MSDNVIYSMKLQNKIVLAVLAVVAVSGGLTYGLSARGQVGPTLTPSPSPAPVVFLEKRIDIDLSEQRLRYYYGDMQLESDIKISSGVAWYPTPKGEFTIQIKKPLVNYVGSNRDGSRYNYPKTKWNLQFLPSYYIHGAYWHNAFGTPRSHGCINVAYKDMEKLYNFADVGTKVTIHQ
jgi:hypothetical protein